ncbi:hypothetical protein VTJ49DRAFT_2958 [Mycothermus thermophilus]|uniref:F-box domain-containing protein n=1 Tax=Humicola insolens TaxID=85995 RepID=A0ABR3V9Z1_HUMIN
MAHRGSPGISSSSSSSPDALPPTYHEATTRPDWLTLVAPYVPLRDYARLCRVSQRFYREFAPRLWGDPIAVLYPDWANLFLAHVKTVRPSTRALVRTFDARRLFASASDFPLCADTTAPLSTVILSKAGRFPTLKCLLLDGQPGLGPETPGDRSRVDASMAPLPPFIGPLLLLSLAGCQSALPPGIFGVTYLRSLVYLDISDMPGSLSDLIHYGRLRSSQLRNLRILKVRGRKINTSPAELLFYSFYAHLWSIDFSRNRLTDAALNLMSHFCFPERMLRLVRFASEGRILMDPDTGSPSFGRWYTVKESDWSSTFSHPLRYLADPPRYALQAPHDGGLHPVGLRLNGLVEILPDSADALKLMFAGPAGSHPPNPSHTRISEVCQDDRGITHLYLNDNPNISAAGLARMIRHSGGQLQRLECNSPAIRLPAAAPPSWLSHNAKLSGFLGWAHVVRPIFSADLQVLRIHHSLVTQIPSLEIPGLSAAVCCWLAETHLLPRAELAYPEVFVPDMNPRLRSLTLSRIPRRSSGPLINKLINFLRLAAVQECAIQEFKASAGRACAAAVLPGLRHIRFEFEPDVFEEEGLPDTDYATDQEYDLDAGTILDDATAQFSFFGDSGWSSSPAAVAPPSTASAYAGPEIPTTDNHRTHTPSPTSPCAPVPGRADDSSDADSELARPASIRSSTTSSQPYPASALADVAVVMPIDGPIVDQMFPRRRAETPSDSASDATNSGGENATSPSSSSISSSDSNRGPGEHYHHKLISHTWIWEEDTHEKFVLIGEPGHSEPWKTDDRGRYPPAVHEYARLAHMPGLQRDPCPVTPNHVAAGLPDGEIIFSAAWEAILYPPPPAEAQTQTQTGATTTTTAAGTTSTTGLVTAEGDDTTDKDNTGTTAEGATRRATSPDDTGTNNTQTPNQVQNRIQKLLKKTKSTNPTTTTATTTTTTTTTTKTPTNPPTTTPPPPPSTTGPIPIPKPTRADLRRMRDVVAALKEYRRMTRQACEEEEEEEKKERQRRKGKQCTQAQTQAQMHSADGGVADSDGENSQYHFHWGGRLEVVL